MINDLILNVTNDCNLQCKYCFVNQEKKYMDLNIAKQAIDYIFNNNINNNVSIHFFGGEPLLCYNSIIVPIVNYCAEQYKNNNYSFSITTNGTLLDEEKLIFLKNNNFSLLLSMDGDEETQNYNRPYKYNKTESFLFLYNKLDLIKQYFPNLTVRATVTSDTVSFLFKNFLFFESNGIKQLHLFPNMLEDWPDNKLQILRQELEKIMLYYIDNYCKNIEPSLKFMPYEKELHNQNFLNCNSCQNHCGTGDGSITIDYKGNIFACQELCTSLKQNNIYLIGNLQTGIDIDKQQILKQNINSTINYCHANAYIKNNNSKEPLPIDIFWHETILKQIQIILFITGINNMK